MTGKKTSDNKTYITIHQSVAILVDGNNIGYSIHDLIGNDTAMLDFDNFIPKILDGRPLNRLIYFREGASISKKLAERLHFLFFGTVVPCFKSADIPLTIHAVQLAEKVDTIIIMSGDADYIELVYYLKSRGVRVEIAAVKKATASGLIQAADLYTHVLKEDCWTNY
jgi:hypothetical protein